MSCNGHWPKLSCWRHFPINPFKLQWGNMAGQKLTQLPSHCHRVRINTVHPINKNLTGHIFQTRHFWAILLLDIWIIWSSEIVRLDKILSLEKVANHNNGPTGSNQGGRECVKFAPKKWILSDLMRFYISVFFCTWWPNSCMAHICKQL